ncbi:MAG: FAD-binding protein, partial [Bacteroidales bacterium]
GIGNIYLNTTNYPFATGDGISMAYRAKALVSDMEFVQFHPTALFFPGMRPTFLISEAVRGFGAILRNKKGENFMTKYDTRGSLAPRDIVARAIDNEMKKHGTDYVYLDCTHLDAHSLVSNFPNIYETCKNIGIDIRKDLIPVAPAAHYICGGIVVDENGCSTIKNLLAGGECTRTGLHGANRLASNSLLEALVFSARSARWVKDKVHQVEIIPNIPQWDSEGTSHPEEMVLITQTFKELQNIMSSYVGIVRSNLRLERALRRLEILYLETEALYKKTIISKEICELRNAINVGYLVIKMAKNRTESIGLHYNIDYPPTQK